MLEVGLGNPAQQIGETGGGQTPFRFFPLCKADAGQEFVGVIARSGPSDGFVNRAYEWMIDGGLGADICQKRVPVMRLVRPQFIEQDEAGDGNLFGEPGSGDGVFRDQFLESVFA